MSTWSTVSSTYERLVLTQGWHVLARAGLVSPVTAAAVPLVWLRPGRAVTVMQAAAPGRFTGTEVSAG